MKKHLLIISIFFGSVAGSQPISVHLMAGFANYNGDLQEKRYTFDQAMGVVGAGISYHATDHLSGRLDASFGHVGANDKRNSKPELIARNLNFTTRIYELSLIGEYSLLSLENHKLSPYVLLGIGLFHFSPYTFNALGNRVYLSGLSTEGQGVYPWKKEYKRTDINVPIGGGLKYALSDDIRIGLEVGLRVLKTDYLDDVSSTYIDQNKLLAARGQTAVDFAFRGDELKNPLPYPAEGTRRGNPKVNDFYYFSILKIDFRLNWFDNGAPRGGRNRSLNCPTKL